MNKTILAKTANPNARGIQAWDLDANKNGVVKPDATATYQTTDFSFYKNSFEVNKLEVASGSAFKMQPMANSISKTQSWRRKR